MRQEIALDLSQKKLDAQLHYIPMPIEQPSPDSQPHFSLSPPPSHTGSDDDSGEETEGEEDNSQLYLSSPPAPQGTQHRLTIPAKPFKQWYILLEHYRLPTTTSGFTTPPPPPNEDTHMEDIEDPILTSPSIGPVAVIKKQVKQTLQVHPIIIFPNELQQLITIDPKEVPGPATIKYHGTPENRNSSWLDAAEWEPLYIIACHDPAFWTWMHGSLTTPTDSRIDDFRRCFALRTAVHQLAVEDDIPKLLQGIRDSFHSRLNLFMKHMAPWLNLWSHHPCL